MTSFLAGFLLLLGLIVALGAQNVLVLRQGLRREHVGLVVALCAASDAVLIAVGVAGLRTITDAVPAVLPAARWGGVLFLLGYAALAARRAARPNAEALVVPDADGTVAAGGSATLRVRPASATSVAATTLALTWLNPHVYLDTVFLMGSAAASHGDGRWLFALGGAAASLTWFVALGHGARRLAPLLRTPRSWRVLDGVVAVVMLVMAGVLALG